MDFRKVRPILIAMPFICLAIAVLTFRDYHSVQMVNQHSASVNATVVSKNIIGGHGTAWAIHYSFTATDGQTYTASQSKDVTPPFYESVAVGSTLPVVYDSENPKISYIEQFKPSTTTLELEMLLTAALGVFLAGMFFYFNSRNKLS